MSIAHKPLLLLILSVCFIFASAQDPAPIIHPLYVGDDIQLSMDNKLIIYYRFNVPDLTPGFDLSITAEPIGDSDINLFFSAKEHYPNSKETSDHFAISSGYSAIYINGAEINNYTDYFLGVQCNSESCSFYLTLDYAQEYYMRARTDKAEFDSTNLNLNHEGTLVARVYVPSSETATHIVIAAELENFDELDEGILMYANKGNEMPTSQSHDVNATVAWKNGKAAYVYKQDTAYFCTGCNYTVVIKAPDNAKITLTRSVYGDIIQTPLNNQRNDAVEKGSDINYLVDTSKLNASCAFIIVEVKPYIGSFKLYAEFGDLPSSYDGYRFKMIGHSDEALYIPVDEGSNQQKLHITIHAEEELTYSIEIYEMGKKDLRLKLGEPEIGTVAKDGVENRLVIVNGHRDMSMTFSLHQERGKADLFVKSCAKKEECSFAKTEVDKILSKEIATSLKSPIIQFSSVADGDEVINVNMDGSVCTSESDQKVPVCYFAVAVLGTSETGNSKYLLTATKTGLHQPLEVNTAVREHLSLDQYQYYYFTVHKDTGINSVNFQVTKISGDVAIFISRDSKYPDANNRENAHHYNDLYAFEKKTFTNLDGTYYIAVKAYTSATFSIIPIVKYDVTDDVINQHHFAKLAQGVPQKKVLDNDEVAYFKFSAGFNHDLANGIEIALNEVQGYFEICVRTDEQVPATDFCQLHTNKTTLIIEAGQEGYVDIGTYLIAVIPVVNSFSNDPTKLKAQSFSITWSTHHQFRILSFSVPLSTWVSTIRTLYYKFEVHPTEDKTIVLHKTTTPSNAKVDLYLSGSVGKFANNVSEFHADKTNNGTDTIKLKETDIVDLCGGQQKVFDASHKCYLYVAVATPSEEDINVVLTLTKDFDDLRLSESVQTYYPFPEENNPLHLYYYPHNFEDITILAHTWERSLTLYANVINTREHQSSREWIYPTDKGYEYNSQGSYAHKGESRLHIPAIDLGVCGADYDKFRCGIAVTLYFGPDKSEGKYNTSNSHYKEFTMFSIIANQEITPIGTGKPIHTLIKANSYRYFDLYVSEHEAILLISANVLTGKEINILATKGKNARPTLDDYQFRSRFGTIETLQISGEETIEGTAKGDWVIAVYADTDTEVILNVVYEATKMIELHRGLPTTVDITKDPVYFEYYHEATSGFELKLTRERGTGTIYIKKYHDDKLLADNLPNGNNSETLRYFVDVQVVISIPNTHKDFCKDCLYVIAVIPDKAMKVSVVAQIPGQFILFHDSMIFADYANSTIFNKYEYVAFNKDRVVDVNVIVYSGDPQIYVSHNPTVNISHNMWYYNESSKSNIIRLKLDNHTDSEDLKQIFDGENQVESDPTKYYIMVTAPIPSSYSIAISVSNSTRYLLDGQADIGFLNVGEYNIYKFHPSKDYASSPTTTKFKLQLAAYNDEFSPAKGKEAHKHITVMSVPPTDKFINPVNPKTLEPAYPLLKPTSFDLVKRDHGEEKYLMNLQYTVPSEHDLYIIVNNTHSPSHLNYSITANTHEPVYLTMNQMYAARVPVGESDIYAVHAGHAGILVLEIHECMGNVVVETSNSRYFVSTVPEATGASLPTGSGSTEAGQIPALNTLVQSSLGPHISLASVEIQDEQTVYIIVTARDGYPDSDTNPEPHALYKIRPQLQALRNFMPFTNLAPGDNGDVQWDITSDGKVKLEFDGVHNLAPIDEVVRSTKFGELKIEYKYDVILTKQSLAASMFMRCDMMPDREGMFKDIDTFYNQLYFDKSNITNDTDHPEHHSIEFDPISDAPEMFVGLRITAIGRDDKGEAVWDYPINYGVIEVKNPETGIYSFLTFLLGLCLVMLVVALAGLYYYYQKFKRVKARLNYEMRDLRNIASTVESFDVLEDSGQKRGYQGFIEEEGV